MMQIRHHIVMHHLSIRAVRWHQSWRCTCQCPKTMHSWLNPRSLHRPGRHMVSHVKEAPVLLMLNVTLLVALKTGRPFFFFSSLNLSRAFFWRSFFSIDLLPSKSIQPTNSLLSTRLSASKVKLLAFFARLPSECSLLSVSSTMNRF